MHRESREEEDAGRDWKQRAQSANKETGNEAQEERSDEKKHERAAKSVSRKGQSATERDRERRHRKDNKERRRKERRKDTQEEREQTKRKKTTKGGEEGGFEPVWVGLLKHEEPPTKEGRTQRVSKTVLLIRAQAGNEHGMERPRHLKKKSRTRGN